MEESYLGNLSLKELREPRGDGTSIYSVKDVTVFIKHEPCHEKTNIVRKASTRISLNMSRRLTWTDTFRLLCIFCVITLYLYLPGAECVGPD